MTTVPPEADPPLGPYIAQTSLTTGNAPFPEHLRRMATTTIEGILSDKLSDEEKFRLLMTSPILLGHMQHEFARHLIRVGRV